MNVIQNLPRKDYRLHPCDHGINNLLARERWHHHKAARRGWIGSIIAALILAVLFVLAAHADMLTMSYPEPHSEPAQGFDWASVFAWTVIIAAIALAIWQAAVSLPIIFNRDQPDAGRK